MVHLRPNVVLLWYRSIDLERDKRQCIGLGRRFQVLVAEIFLVCGDLLELKILGRALQQWHKVRAIVRGPPAYINTGDNLRVDAAHQMDLDPLPIINLTTILLVKPPYKAACTEARGIDRKVVFYPLERQT